MNRTIVCLKWGDKYSAHYVNVLFSMCKRHNKEPFSFVCFTDNSNGLDSDIIIKKLPDVPLHSWWFKVWIFSQENNLKGPVLFLDLDLVVYEDIEKLWNYETNYFCVIRDFTRHLNPSWNKFNSSVFKFQAENYYWVWDDFYKDYKNIITKHHGDQDYLYSILKDKSKHWPDNWIQSYKWEMRNKSDLVNINNKRNFAFIADPKIDTECCIAVFHGDPNPDQVKDPWVVDRWK